MVMIAAKKSHIFTPYLVQRHDGVISPTIELSFTRRFDLSVRATFSLSLKKHSPFEIELVDKTAS